MEHPVVLSPPAKPLLGIIGGTSLLNSSYFANLEQQTVSTDYGAAVLHFGLGFVFCQRHHADPARSYTPPHLINYKAIISAMKKSGVERLICFASTGSLKRDIEVGTVVLIDDFFCPWTIMTLFDDARSHIVPVMDKDFRKEVIQVVQEKQRATMGSLEGFALREGGTYVQTTGPRFETPAEIRAMAQWGEVVAMTAANEIILSSELGIKTAVVCMVDNYANGLVDHILTVEEFRAGVKRNEKVVEGILDALLEHFAGVTKKV
jgi:5'-methylthioadenosine phosphorylase